MINIKNKNDLKFWYEILKAIETKLTKNDRTIIRIKKAIRSYIHKDNNITIYDNINRKLIIKKIPDDWTEDFVNMRHWFYWFEYQGYPFCLYGYTGQWFTSNWKITKKNNEYYLYHLLCRNYQKEEK